MYKSKSDWLNASQKRVSLIGMSGLGKTYLSDLLREGGDWFHYSVDYRIGTHYMGEYIVDNFKKEAMKVPFLAEHLLSDSIYIASNITFENLSPLSRYLGKPGDPSKGGISFADYMERQAQHCEAEISATQDAVKFNLVENEVDPDNFIRWSYRQMLDDRLPRYAAIAQNWGIAIDADAFHGVTTSKDFEKVIADHLT